MADAGDRLRIKYGLGTNPSRDQQRRWADIVDRLVAQGYSKGQAGRMAAKELFVDFETNFYASEGDTIDFLLRQVRDK
ncbi:hypothetical protein [Brevundimonas sp.]|uniref:hypothetical protein n=1 Tax=Brevundimonas sp. TaxID=1871086 RepID=UPI0028997A4B|nr:hypothetical protein [Brevundimonas sp.]